MALKTPRYRREKNFICIEMKLKRLSQLFDSMDPSPFIERDLDRNAVDYIVSATMEHSIRMPIVIIIYLRESGDALAEEKAIKDSVHNHFNYSAELARKKLKHIFRRGQISFAMGLLILFLCLLSARSLNNLRGNFTIQVLCEGLMIIGWVALSRPVDVFLYAWWPQLEMCRVYKKLSRTAVHIRENKKTGTNFQFQLPVGKLTIENQK